MKKTCFNCAYYCFELCNPKNPEMHFHNWCEKWQTFVPDMEIAGQYDYREDVFNTDLETGDAVCFLFKPVKTPLYDDAWFENNKQKNLSNRVEDTDTH
jgi:hypothetical protein